jgi:hypothetical protein
LKIRATLKLSRDLVLVNPNTENLFNREVIFNQRTSVDCNKLSETNVVYSRIPIIGAKLIPYEVPLVRVLSSPEDYSLVILNSRLMSDIDKTREVDTTQYLLGIDSMHDGYLTSVGYKLLESELNDTIS